MAAVLLLFADTDGNVSSTGNGTGAGAGEGTGTVISDRGGGTATVGRTAGVLVPPVFGLFGGTVTVVGNAPGRGGAIAVVGNTVVVEAGTGAGTIFGRDGATAVVGNTTVPPPIVGGRIFVVDGNTDETVGTFVEGPRGGAVTKAGKVFDTVGSTVVLLLSKILL